MFTFVLICWCVPFMFFVQARWPCEWLLWCDGLLFQKQMCPDIWVCECCLCRKAFYLLQCYFNYSAHRMTCNCNDFGNVKLSYYYWKLLLWIFFIQPSSFRVIVGITSTGFCKGFFVAQQNGHQVYVNLWWIFLYLCVFISWATGNNFVDCLTNTSKWERSE